MSSSSPSPQALWDTGGARAHASSPPHNPCRTKYLKSWWDSGLYGHGANGWDGRCLNSFGQTSVPWNFWSILLMRIVILLAILLPSLSLASRLDDLYIGQEAIIRRGAYADNLQQRMRKTYNAHFSMSLFGDRLEHIKIISPACRLIKDYKLINAKEIGITSCTCNWFDVRYMLSVE